MKIYFASGNKAKQEQLKYVADYFGYPVEVINAKEMFKVDYEENGRTCMDIAVKGAKHVFSKIKKPVVVEDSIIYISALKGPGLKSNKFLKEKKVEGALNLMKHESDRSCYIESCVVYYDGKILKKFRNKVAGRITYRKSYRQGEPIWVGPSFHEFGGGYNSIYEPWFIEDLGKTLADATKEEGLVYGYRERNFKTLLDFLFEKV
ncbi:MAG: non-canonical purine NTP pyrophosphatase [Nanoarchaeota archaeon]|nr:non-canonical purine NTP pyrophosphatase [Nanoarchaeota archaeon]